MKTLRSLICVCAALLIAHAAWAQEAEPQVDKDALRAQSKEITKAMEGIRSKLKKNPEVQDLLAKRLDIMKQLEAKYAELDPKFAELLKQRREIRRKLGWGKGAKGKGRERKGKGTEKKAPK